MKRIDVINIINTRMDNLLLQCSTDKKNRLAGMLNRLHDEFMGEINKELGDNEDISTIPLKVTALAEEWERMFQKICSGDDATVVVDVVQPADESTTPSDGDNNSVVW